MLVELIREHLGPLDPSPVTYESLGQALRVMEPCNQWFAVWSISMLKILQALGYGVDLRDPQTRHRPPAGLSPEALMFMARGLDLGSDVLIKLNISARGRREIQRYLIGTCKNISDRPLKSTEFLAKLLDVDNAGC